MKFTSVILSLAALFSVASAGPTPSPNDATLTYNAKYDSLNSASDIVCTNVDTITITNTKRSSPIVIGGASPDSPFSCGACLQVTLEEVDVFITVIDDGSTDIDIIEVSSDVITEFIAVTDDQTEDIETVTIDVVVFEVDASYCL
jgi:hypothetical protein